MARRKTLAPETGAQILPERLVRREGLSAAGFAEQGRERRRWFLERGIDPGDWSAVYPILRASRHAYGIPSALERARRRAEGA